MKKLIAALLSSLLLNACQTHLPIVSEHIAEDDVLTMKPCESNIEKMELADIDYLLYANRMVDSMIQDKTVQQKLSRKRLKIAIEAISRRDNADRANMTNVNSTVKNRLLRSGQFIIVNNKQTSNVQLSGSFETIQNTNNHCIESYEQFSLQLKDSHSKQLIWSDKKQFK